MGLENLKSIFAEGAAINNSQIGGRHGEQSHPTDHSILDDLTLTNYQTTQPLNSDESKLIFLTGTHDSPNPTNSITLRQLGKDTLYYDQGDSKNQSWENLYESNHKSKNSELQTWLGKSERENANQ